MRRFLPPLLPDRLSCHWGQDCSADGELRHALDHAAIVSALVATLKHESPLCVAAAAAALGRVAQTPGVGKAKIAASGAIPALLNVIGTLPAPGNLEQATGLFRGYVSKQASLKYACAWLIISSSLTYTPVCIAVWIHVDPWMSAPCKLVWMSAVVASSAMSFKVRHMHLVPGVFSVLPVVNTTYICRPV
jgi:hypothetical protein